MAKALKIWTAVCALTLGLGLLASGCGDVGVSDETCPAGTTCKCTGVGQCTKTCDGKDCEFRCSGQGNCLMVCEEGGCEGYASGQGNATLECPGGDCSLTCTGQGGCELTECKGGCSVVCENAGGCTCSGGCD